MSKLFFISFLVILPKLNCAQPTLEELYNDSQQAKTNQDYPLFLSLTKRAMNLHPSHPALLNNLAIGYALNGKTDSAIMAIKRNITYNANYPFSQEPSFEKLRTSANYSDLSLLANSLEKTFSMSRVYLKAKTKALHIEDISIIDNKIYATDVNGGKLIRIDPDGSIHELQDLSSSVMAIVAESDDKLWIATSMMPQFKDYDSTLHYETAIYKYDITKSKIVKKIDMDGEHVLGAGCTGRNGNIYFTDSTEPVIYRLNTTDNKIDHFLTLEDAHNLQGITYDLSNDVLYVADYIKGIVKIDLKDNTKHWFNSNDFLLKGIDGLMKVNEGLIAIQNGSAQKRVIFLTWSDVDNVIVKIIDNNLEYGGEPTNGKVMDGRLYYIANSPWPFYDDGSKALQDKWESLEIRVWNGGQ